MRHARQPILRPALRLWAALSVLVWIAASAQCAMEPLIGSFHTGASHHTASAAHDHHGDEAVPAHQETGHSHDSDRNGDHGDSCCTSLKAVLSNTTSVQLTQPDFGQLFAFNPLWLAQALTPVEPETSPPRQAKNREWVFTPEVCLGPAHRSHAPPASV